MGMAEKLKQSPQDVIDPQVAEKMRFEEAKLRAGGMRAASIDKDTLRAYAEGRTNGYSMMDVREIHEDVPVKHSVFERFRGFMAREHLVDAEPPIWTESAEDYNERIRSYDPQAELSDDERAMVSGEYADYIAKGGLPQHFNPWGPLANAYADRAGEPRRSTTQVFIPRIIEADPGRDVIHRDGPPPPPTQLAA